MMVDNNMKLIHINQGVAGNRISGIWDSNVLS